MTSRFERIKDLYKQVIASELISLADDPKKKEEEDELGGLAEGLLTEKVEAPTAPKKKEEESTFIPPEELGEQLGGGKAPPKKAPILPHREKEKTLRTDLPEEMETTKFTPGEIKGKVCDICGRFNFPAWRRECAFCKRTYNYMRDLIYVAGYTLNQAVRIASGDVPKGFSEEELSGLITSPEKLSTKKKYYLDQDQLREIWFKNGKILLPEQPEDLSMRFEDKRGLIGVPARIKLQYALETRFNVEKVDKEVLDPRTGKTIKVKDVYFDHEGHPIPIKYRERDYLTLFEIGKRLKLEPAAVLQAISDFNTSKGLEKTDEQAIKPAIYFDDLNQAFSWKKSIEPVFKNRILEVYEMFKNTYLYKLSVRKEKLDTDIMNIGLNMNMVKHNIERITDQVEKLPNAKVLLGLSKLRQEVRKLTKEIEELESKPDKREPLLKRLAKINEVKGPAEQKFGRMLDYYGLDNFVEQMDGLADELKRKKQSRINVLIKFKDYITAVGKPGEAPKSLTPADLQKAQTGHASTSEGDVNMDELGAELMGEKKAYRVNSFLKFADEESKKKWWEKDEDTKQEPLPGQLDLPFQKYDPFRKHKQEEALKQIMRGRTEQEEEVIKRKVKNIMKGKLTREEAEDRLDAAGDPLADEEDLTQEQKMERNKKIHKLMLESPTEDEARARIESAESKPLPLRPREMVSKPKEIEGDLYEERECPACKEKKIMKGSERCSNCGFISAPNRKDVIVEQTKFRFVFDANGNKIPKLDDDGNQMFDARGQPMFRKRPEKMQSLVSIQFDDAGEPKWATARKVSSATPDPGAKTKEEREKFYERMEKELPRIREIKPLTKTPDDYRPIYEFQIDDKTGKEVRVDTGMKEHKQKCKGCPEPGVKVTKDKFNEYPTIVAALSFINGEELGNNVKAWLFKDLYKAKKEEPEKPGKHWVPTILPLGSSRFEQIVKLSKMP